VIARRAGKIRLLFIIDVVRVVSGGTERHLQNLLRHLDRERYECDVVAFDLGAEFAESLEELGVRVWDLPLGRIYGPKAMRQMLRLRKVIRDGNVDIVQTYHAKADTFGVVAAKLAGTKHTVSSRRDTGDRKKPMYRFLSRLTNRLFDRFITVCDAVGESVSRSEGVPREKQLTIYNGVDLERFRPHGVSDVELSRLRSELGLREEDFVVGMIANFRPEKSFDVFLEAVRRARASIPEIKALAIGKGPTLDACERVAREPALLGVVGFPGRLNDVRGHIALMDVACLTPSSNEGFSNAILEKMAMGKPLVVTDVGGNRESVADRENGFVVPPNDPERVCAAIVELHRDREKRRRMGRNSRERVERLFTMDRMIRNHEELYEAILAGDG
jgi:glycosyltransferase involved in cell wall biosynthesis